MNIDNLKDSLTEQFEDLKNRIAESPAYNSAKEKFETLSPKAQKGIVFGAIALLAFFMIYIPMSYVWQSQDYVTEYEDKRQVIRELLKYGDSPQIKAPLPPETDSTSVVASIRSTLSTAQILNEQIANIEPAQGTKSSMAKPPIVQTDITAALKWLNITQVVNIAHKLKKMSSNVKLTGIQLDASTEADKKNYFNVKYTLSSFSLSLPTDTDKKKRSRRGRRQ